MESSPPFIGWWENWFEKQQNGFCLVVSQSNQSTMGYSSKRRRSQRKRSRTLSAIQNTSNGQPSISSSDDESCYLDVGPQPSSSTSFCSSPSQHTSTPNHTIPNSIFLDNGNTTTHAHEMNQEQEDTNEEDESWTPYIHNMEEVLYYSQGASSDEEDDVTVHSAESFSEDNKVHDGRNLHPLGNNCFRQMTSEEAASYKILSLLDSAGAPRVCYDRLVALLKKLSKSGFDVQKVIKRDTLMKRLEKYKARPRIQICSIKKQEVFRICYKTCFTVVVNTYTTLYHFQCKAVYPLVLNMNYGIPHG